MKFAANLNLKGHQFFFTHPVYIPVVSDKSKMKVSEGAIISADNFKILAGVLSKPVALHAFRPLKVEATLSTCIGENFKKYLRIG